MRRNVRVHKVSTSKLDKYYKEIKELKAKGCSFKEIASLITSKYGMKVSHVAVFKFLEKDENSGTLVNNIAKAGDEIRKSLGQVIKGAKRFTKSMSREEIEKILEDSKTIEEDFDGVLSDLMNILIARGYDVMNGGAMEDVKIFVETLDKTKRLQSFIRSDNPLKDDILNINIQVIDPKKGK